MDRFDRAASRGLDREEDAYNIVKAIFEKKADLVAVHKEAENFTMENQKKENSPIPFHPGAAKYFAEERAGTVKGCQLLERHGPAAEGPFYLTSPPWGDKATEHFSFPTLTRV